MQQQTIVDFPKELEPILTFQCTQLTITIAEQNHEFFWLLASARRVPSLLYPASPTTNTESRKSPYLVGERYRHVRSGPVRDYCDL